jgi:hypothetical protein
LAPVANLSLKVAADTACDSNPPKEEQRAPLSNPLRQLNQKVNKSFALWNLGLAGGWQAIEALG